MPDKFFGNVIFLFNVSAGTYRFEMAENRGTTVERFGRVKSLHLAQALSQTYVRECSQ